VKNIWLSRTLEAAVPEVNRNARPEKVFAHFRPFLEQNPITAVDVGTRGDLPGEWEPLVPVLRLVAIEPDPAEAARLRERFARRSFCSADVLPAAIGPPGGEVTLHVTREPGSSSFFEPNAEVAGRYGAPERFEVVERRRVGVRPLGEVLAERGIGEVDILKADVQGFELEVLRTLGAERWARLLLAEVEVEFVELYKGQPLFRHVDEHIGPQGFELFHLNRTFANYRGGRWMPYGRGQLVFGDAYYLRTRLEGLPAPGLGKLIFLAAFYGFSDYAYFLYRENEARLRELGEEQLAPFRSFFRPFDRARPRLGRLLSLGLRFVLDRLLFTYLAWRRWNGIKTDSDRSYPLR